jgi:hypothetical protein
LIAAKLPLTDDFAARITYLFKLGWCGRNRVLFEAADNLMSPPRLAAAEMQDTWDRQNALKRAAGIKPGGRRCRKPVRHDVLSWHADERSDTTEMLRAARSYLQAIGLDGHEAVIVGHDHNGKRHVHIIASTIDPLTGRVADMTGDQWKAQAWCLAYEQALGLIRCKHRIAPMIVRTFDAATGKRQSAQRLSRPAWERRRKRKEGDQEARARHKAATWAKLIVAMQANAANERRPPDKQKADTRSAPRP